jgi:hypothetical protein
VFQKFDRYIDVSPHQRRNTAASDAGGATRSLPFSAWYPAKNATFRSFCCRRGAGTVSCYGNCQRAKSLKPIIDGSLGGVSDGVADPEALANTMASRWLDPSLNMRLKSRRSTILVQHKITSLVGFQANEGFCSNGRRRATSRRRTRIHVPERIGLSLDL